MAMRQVVGAVGAVIGGYIGGPSGAQMGWMIGSAVGGIVDPEILRGPQIGEIASQTSQEGGPRPIIFGLSPPMSGNIIATGEAYTRRHRRRQGKGGPKVETETVHRTYAIGICEGPITRVVRVWRNGSLVFDATEEQDFNFYSLSRRDQILNAFGRLFGNNTLFAVTADFYLGTYDQNADPQLEQVFGVGTTPAFRGTAYMRVFDDDLTDYRGAIPQYMFQVERCEGFHLTSRPYAVEEIDALNTGGGFRKESPFYILDEALDMSGALLSGTLADTLEEYDDAVPEALDLIGELLEGELRVALREYEDAEPEAIDMAGELLSGELDVVLITYEIDPEALDVSGSLLSGSLT